MKKIVKVVLIISIMIFIHISSYASTALYEADEYIIKIQNIDEPIEEICLVNVEECSIDETGTTYTDSIEEVSLYGQDEIPLVTGYDSENYYIKQTVIYNYLYGDAAQNPEITTKTGHSQSGIRKNVVSISYATDKKFKNKKEFQKECKDAKDYNFICMRSITYTAYRILKSKELDVSTIKNDNFTYKHDDLSNLKIGLRTKSITQEYKTFISDEYDMWMSRSGGETNRDKEKIVIFDYVMGNYKTNTNKPLENSFTNRWYGIIYFSICFIIAILIVKLDKIIKSKKANK